MPDLKITSESLEAAKQAFRNAHADRQWLDDAFAAGLDALCVPQEQEGWFRETGRWHKGDYTLLWLANDNHRWHLRKNGECSPFAYCEDKICGPLVMTISGNLFEAVAVWANAKIAEYEALQNRPEWQDDWM